VSNSKISALTSATTPLAGTETLPVVQSSATTQVTVANLTAGRAVSAASLSLTTTPLSVGNGGTGLTTLTTGYIPYGNGSGAYSSTVNLFYDSANIRLSVGVGSSPAYPLDVYNTIRAYNAGNPTGALILGSNASNAASRNWGLNGNFNAFGDFGILQSNALKGDPISAGTFRLYFGASGGASFGDTTDPGAGNLRIGTGNVIQGTAAKGFDFSANTPAAGKTSTVLNWYEEGTWTPNQGAGLTLVGAFSSTGKYTRIGRQVSISGTVTGATSVAVSAAGVITTSLPFTIGTAGHGDATNTANTASAAIICNTGTTVTAAGAIAATGTITFSATYFA